MKKIWLLCANRWNSAITEYALSTARALTLSNHQVVVTSIKEKALWQRCVASAIVTAPVEAFSLAKFLTFKKLCLTLEPDIIITFGGPETLLAQFLKFFWRFALFRCRGYDSPDKFFDKVMHKIAHHNVDAIIVPGHQIYQQMRNHQLHANLQIITLGIDAKLYTPKYHNYHIWQNSRPQCVVLGRLDPIKGHREFIAIFAKILSKWPRNHLKPQLVIVGLPANLSGEDIRHTAKDYNLIENADFVLVPHFIKELAELLSAATIGIIPSLGSELICRVAQEFLMCGTPVLVSQVGSLADVLFNDDAGMSFSQFDPKMIRFIIKSHEEHYATRQRRAQLAAQYFSLEAMAKSWQKIIN